MDERPSDHDFKQEKDVLLTLLKLRGLVNYRAYDKLNVLFVVGETFEYVVVAIIKLFDCVIVIDEKELTPVPFTE